MATDDEQSRALDLLLVAHCIVQSISYIPIVHMDYDNHFTNYFYRNGSDINLCVPDTEFLRHFASLLSVDHMVWFGHNSYGPVELVSLNEVICSIRAAPPS